MNVPMIECPKCETNNAVDRYFCEKCGSFLRKELFNDEEIYNASEVKMMRIAENLANVPHIDIVWQDTVDLYSRKVEQLKAVFELDDLDVKKLNSELSKKMMSFLESCRKPEFQIAFVGTIKTGKSTLINALLGNNYASMDVTPETAALTKFRYSAEDYIHVTFYTKDEWKNLWKSITTGADDFIKEYNDLKADAIKDKWIDHKPIFKKVENHKIKDELVPWSSSKCAEHYFVKEIEVGISSLPKDFPPEVVFVDTPGLSDPVEYRSAKTKQYIQRANAVFVCIQAKTLSKEEIETISTVFSFSSHNKEKVFIIATQWDNLNNPDKDWKKQRSDWEKRLVGKAFFDNPEMARNNIMASAAYIYNLCRDFKTLEREEKKILAAFSIKMDLPPFPDEIEKNLESLKTMANIDNISKKITDSLAINYKNLLTRDLGKNYSNIIYDLRRIGEEKSMQEQDLIETSMKSFEEIEKKVAKQEKNQQEIKEVQKQLTAVLSATQKQTEAQMKTILGIFDNYIDSLEKIKK